ncbi:MAG: ATP-binding protein [Candidatus Methanoperedens sp.]|nr:ATP-binding protein [Candidatus Methanoperedens sp.]
MAEDLLTNILILIYTTLYGIGEQIAGLIQYTLGVSPSRITVDAIGFLIAVSIILVIIVVAKKTIWKGKNSAAGATVKPKNEKQTTIEAISEPEIKTQSGEETISAQRMDKNETNEMIHKPRKYPETLISSRIMTLDGNNLKQLIRELQKIDQLIRFNLDKWKKEHSKDANDFLGLYITENEVNAILTAPAYELEPGKINEEIQILPRDINESLEKEKPLRLQDLQRLFKLDPFEVEALLICLASELDTRYEKLYSYLQNDVTKKRPTVDLVINLLCPSVEGKLKAREYFSPEANLIRNRLIYLAGEGPEGQIPLLSRSIKVDERIISYLLGSDEIDQRIRNFSLLIEPGRSFDDLIFPEEEKDGIKELIKRRQNIRNPMFFFQGAYGTGKKMTAEIICRDLCIPLLAVDARILKKREVQDISRIIIREALLQNSALYLEGFDVLLEKEAGIDVSSLVQELDLFPNWVFLAGELPYSPSGILKNHSFIEMAFPIPSFTVRKKLWEALLDEKVPDLDIDALAGKFNFSGGQIKDAISTARNFAIVRNPADNKMTLDDLYRGCKAQSNKNLSLFARSISPRYTWNDIVLPKDLKEHLKEVSGYIKHRGKVYTDWGFDAKLSLGKGLNVLFSGPSGAGKTMAAEILAKEVGLDIYKIDLSTVVSKYIGETEKHLNKIFVEAETSNAILFFDEADALFGKRSEVKDSHDRYANIEINYLLQKMEEHEGIVILASNFKTNIDEAFMRRMHFVMEFPFPEEDLREKIWRNIFPKATPVGEDVDYSFLSKFKITGGNIKNIALSAAFLAAGDSGIVKMEHIIRATKREFQKMGKLCTAGEFGEYYNLVK